jgi:hypothetical protein
LNGWIKKGRSADRPSPSTNFASIWSALAKLDGAAERIELQHRPTLIDSAVELLGGNAPGDLDLELARDASAEGRCLQFKRGIRGNGYIDIAAVGLEAVPPVRQDRARVYLVDSPFVIPALDHPRKLDGWRIDLLNDRTLDDN